MLHPGQHAEVNKYTNTHTLSHQCCIAQHWVAGRFVDSSSFNIVHKIHARR